MRIETLPEGLYDAAVALWHDVGLTRPWNDPEQDLRRAMAGPASTVLAAVDADRLLATAMVGHDGHRGWVYYLAVRRDEQGQGLGREMMRACEQWVQGHAVPKVQLMVRTDNAEALSFYAAVGYDVSDVTVLARRLDE